MSRADEIIERALTAPTAQLEDVQREIIAFAKNDSSSEEDIDRVLAVGECVQMRRTASPGVPTLIGAAPTN
jgi:transcription termination factor NusB